MRKKEMCGSMKIFLHHERTNCVFEGSPKKSRLERFAWISKRNRTARSMLPSLMAPRIDPMGGHQMRLGPGQARFRAIVCARGAGNLIFVRLTPVAFEIKKRARTIIYSSKEANFHTLFLR